MRRFALQRFYFPAPTHALLRLVYTLPRPSLALLPPGSLLLRALPYPARQAISSSLCGVQHRSCPSCLKVFDVPFSYKLHPLPRQGPAWPRPNLAVPKSPTKATRPRLRSPSTVCSCSFTIRLHWSDSLGMHILLLSMCVQGASGHAVTDLIVR